MVLIVSSVLDVFVLDMSALGVPRSCSGKGVHDRDAHAL
jgi:hypothetical protein